ncbi:MAG: HAD family phosphatase [Eubacterium sp.]|nr:HAD family phosphatase [Eubacterium sp.]
MDSSIKNVVFDVGDVLASFRVKDYLRELGFDEDLVELLANGMVFTEFWHELDLGTKTQADGIRIFTEKYPQYKDEILLFWEKIDRIVEEYDYSEPLVKAIKDKGYGVYILSNYPIETAELHWPKFKFLPLTDGHIISGYEKITKPDEGIYRLLESRFGIKLTDCLFVDDRLVNVEAAKRYGMKAILFKGYEELITALKDYGINI